MTDNPGQQLAVSKMDRLKVALAADSVQMQFKNVLGENSSAFSASIIDLYAGDPYLQECDPGAVILQALKAAILKLPVVKSLGLAFIVPYKSNGVSVPQFQIGWKGYVQLAIRSGQYEIINAEEVYEGEYVLKNKLTGEFDLTGTRASDTVIGYFAYFKLKNGYSKTLYMTVKQMNDHAAKYSKSYNNQYSPWKTELLAMAKKTMLRLLLGKYGLLSIEMSVAFSDDDAGDRAESEITQNANTKNFEAADVVKTDINGQGNTAAGGGANSVNFNAGNNDQNGNQKPPF